LHINERSQVNWKLFLKLPLEPVRDAPGNAGVLAGSLKPGEADGNVGVLREA